MTYSAINPSYFCFLTFPILRDDHPVASTRGHYLQQGAWPLNVCIIRPSPKTSFLYVLIKKHRLNIGRMC